MKTYAVDVTSRVILTRELDKLLSHVEPENVISVSLSTYAMGYDTHYCALIVLTKPAYGEDR